MFRVLIVDDDAGIRKLIQLVCVRKGLQTEVASDGVEALQKIEEGNYAVVVIDLMMPRLNGYDLVERLGELQNRPAVVIVTAMPDIYIATLDMRFVRAVVRKPFDIDVLGAILLESTRSIEPADGLGAVEERLSSLELVP